MYYWGGKEDDMVWRGAHGTCKGEEKYIQVVWAVGGLVHGWDDNIKMDLGRAWTGLIWVSKGEMGEMWTQWWTSSFHEMWGISG
jgi:hypothetical protein